jgi:hypothetical protein
MNIVHRLLVFLVIILITGSCGMQAKLNRNFKGKPIEDVAETFADLTPAKVPMPNGHTKVIYTKEERLSGTTINQGVNTLDPIHSPSVTKVEQFIFIVDENGVVISTKYESTYKRL